MYSNWPRRPAVRPARPLSRMPLVTATFCCLPRPGRPREQIIAGLGDLNGKILIDATNPLLPDLSGLTHGTTTSGGEQVAGWASGAKVVKAFNTVGANIMADPSFEGHKPVMFYCGDDAAGQAGGEEAD